MSSSSCDVLFVGNAIMDVIAPCDDDFLIDNQIEKGGMNLIDEARALALLDDRPRRRRRETGLLAVEAEGHDVLDLAIVDGRAPGHLV